MSVKQRNNVAYGISDALLGVPSFPIASKRSPSTGDKAQLGTIWVNTVTDDAYVLTSITANSATWVVVAGGAGDFTNITATGTITADGDITSTGGDIEATAGDVIVGGVVNSTGSITSTLGALFGEGVYAQGDFGAEVGAVGLTNVRDETQGIGVMTILSTNGNSGNNTGFIKVYVDGIAAFIPYFDDIAP